jgi:hypothetical protein
MLITLAAACTASDEAMLGADDSELNGGTVVPTGTLEAVARVGGCTGTLITDTAVLFAAHCVCDDASPGTCATTTRRTVTFDQVFGRYDDPNTPVDERTTRTNRSIAGTAVHHPDYGTWGWNTNDYAIVKLDRRASDEVVVTPIRVELDAPSVGDPFTLVGYGDTGPACTGPSGTKRRGVLPLVDIKTYADPRAGATLIFEDPNIFTCHGDSGGPVINSAGRVAGVSSVGVNAGNAAYDATYVATDWIADHACPPFDPTRPDAAFCDDPLCPCGPAEGDCDDNGECLAGSSCQANLGALAGLPAHYDVCWSTQEAITAYQGISYTGASQLFPAGTWRDIDMTTVGNDEISSIRVRAGYVVRACQNATGTTCVTYSSSMPWLGSNDDQISYLRVSPAVTLYDGTGFSGTAQTLAAGTYGSDVLATGVGNDRASSLIAAPGINVRLCTENGGWGTCQEFGGRVTDLGSPLNGNTSNVEVRPGVSVYRDAGFGGVQQTFPTGTFSTLSIVGSNQISSLVVAPGYQARLCDGANLEPCQVYTGWVPFVGATMENRASWLQVSAVSP